jgi:hypothetical protein
MAGQGDGTVIVPWYATGFRAEGFGAALNEVAAIALRYGASSYAVYRGRDDRYRYQQLAAFERYADWERYWEGPEMIDFRTRHSSWYQVPVLYGWWDLTAAGALSEETEWAVPEPPAPEGNGHGGNGSPARPGTPHVQHV